MNSEKTITEMLSELLTKVNELSAVLKTMSDKKEDA